MKKKFCLDEFCYFWHLYSEITSDPDKFYIMNIHEYQGKEILVTEFAFNGIVANNAVEAVAAAKQLTTETGTSWYVVKAQVHAGGRGKGGGVKLAKNLQQVEEISGQIIGMQLVTPQTSSAEKKCTKF
jgi:succinyl-CoA synthetase beta subunit